MDISEALQLISEALQIRPRVRGESLIRDVLDSDMQVLQLAERIRIRAGVVLLASQVLACHTFGDLAKLMVQHSEASKRVELAKPEIATPPEGDEYTVWSGTNRKPSGAPSRTTTFGNERDTACTSEHAGCSFPNRIALGQRDRIGWSGSLQAWMTDLKL